MRRQIACPFENELYVEELLKLACAKTDFGADAVAFTSKVEMDEREKPHPSQKSFRGTRKN